MPDIFISNEPDTNTSTEEKKPNSVKKHEGSTSSDNSHVKNVVPRTDYEGPTHNRLSAFCLYPENIGFETKANEEKIILMLRQHPIVNLKWILTSAILLAGPTLLSMFGVFSMLPTGYPLVVTLAWYLVTSAYALEGFLNWYFNVYFITTLRIVDVDFYNIIDKRVSNAEIEKIEDVSYTTGGVIRTVLNYGDVFIQTAAEVSEFDFRAVPNPEKVVKILDDLRSKV